MMLKGKGWNLQVLTECCCYLIFGYLLFRLTYSGEYLNYVTPRMKPYLYGMSALMLLWTVLEGRNLLTPQYKANLSRSFVFIIPILLLAVRPAAPGGSSMIQNYDGSGISLAAGNGSGILSARGNKTTPSEKKDFMADSQEALETDTPSENRTATKNTGSPEGITEGIADEAADEITASEDESPWYDLNGLDEDTKTITIADEDYYTWMYELSSFYEKYEGYTVVMKGFIYKDPEIEKISDFALVRLSMWCCAADLSPIGFLVDCSGILDFKEDDWVVVKGTLEASADGQTLMLKAQSIDKAEKPATEYVYPYF
ncbi:putative membrane protein [Hungatella effluvii]|uniref:Putative membrane protein n=1 Tax=Hungatella effluvii TaxID=1096246 RepID=A0A2V3Y3S6_9FIRM|nr:TIGR03943 family protein [Hungatella effluvii]PXX53022.1 putative membrane protein [Hungatella effluvii]